MPQPHERGTGGAVHSLPSFAQAFSNLSNDDRSLPPIQLHQSRSALSPPAPHRHRISRRPSSASRHVHMSKKRPRDESPGSDGYESSGSSSARPAGIKVETDLDQLAPSPPPPPRPSSRLKHVQPPQAHMLQRHDSNSSSLSGSGGVAPPPSLARPPPALKRRRVTISGVAQPLNTNLRSSDASLHTPTQGAASGYPSMGPSTPISPVVMGFTIQRDDPQAFEQVRSMLTVKQKQKALIESRRGSVAGLADGRRGSTAGMIEGRRGSIPGLPAVVPIPSVSVVNPTPTSATAPTPSIGSPAVPKRNGPSPNGSSTSSRLVPSPPAMTVPSNINSSPGPRSVAIGSSNGSVPPGSGASANARAHSPAGHIVPSQSQPLRLSSLRSPPTSHNGPSPSQSVHAQPYPHSQGQASFAAPSLSQSSSQGQSQSQSQNQNQSLASSQTSAQQLATQGLTALANALPPLPTSFARRRAGQLGMRGKPADIVISPRDSEAASPVQGASSKASASGQNPPSFNYKTLQPAIQSAPPRPGQMPGRFPMALPSLPPAVGQRGTSLRRMAPGQVPPTPTGLSLHRQQGSKETMTVRLSQSGRSPGIVASSTVNALLPPTPATLNQPANTSSDKAAFLAPFEQFYDALSDARVLKGWFGEQLARVGRVAREVEDQKAEVMALKADLEKQKETTATASEGINGTSESRMERVIAEAIQRELSGWKDEILQLRNRVVELEEELSLRGRGAQTYDVRDSGREMPEMNRTKVLSIKNRGANGVQPTQRQQVFPVAPSVETYTFPPVQPPVTIPLPSPPSAATDAAARNSSPSRSHHQGRSNRIQASRRSPTRSEASASPAPFESRRLSVSAMRYDLPTQTRRQQELSNAQAVVSMGSPRRPESNKSSPELKAKAADSNAMPGPSNSKESLSSCKAPDDTSKVGEEKPSLKRHNSHSSVMKTRQGDRPSHSRQNSTEQAKTSPKNQPRRAASPMEEDD